jgi:RNA polymerase sigma-70 factor (ECF subfamily)
MSENLSFNEFELIERLNARDQSALSDLYQRFGAFVYGLSLRVLNNRELAEEVTQDVFLKVWNQAYRWDSTRGKVVTWLMTITRYTAIDRLRKEQRQAPNTMIPLDDIFELIGQRGSVGQPEQVDAQVLRSLIVQLPPEQVEVIELAFYGGMSHSEIAEYLAQPLGTVKSRIRIGLQRLKALWLTSMPSKE